MSQDLYEELLDYYQQEILYLRHAGGRFAEKYPNIAEGLNLTSSGTSDPHVERLLESFAFLTARLQKEIDNKYVRFSNTLLEVLYPQFVTPIPSCSTVQMKLSPHLGKSTAGYVVKKGTKLFTQALSGEVCHFTTCYDTELWPFEVIDGDLIGIDNINISQKEVNTTQFLRIRVRRYDGVMKELKPQKLRLHLAGGRMTTNFLYDAIFSYDAEGPTPVYIQGDGDEAPKRLPDNSLRSVGFGDRENLVPYPYEVHKAYQFIQEYFVFSAKYKYLDVYNFDTSGAKEYLDILIPVAASATGERFQVSKNNFALGATPVVNLFPKISEPIDLNHRALTYRLIPDQRNEATTEVHSILKVLSTVTGSPDAVTYEPYFSYNHDQEKKDQKLFWHALRSITDIPNATGTDVDLSFVNFDFTPEVPASETVYAHLLCTNRSLPTFVPAGAQLQVDGELPPVTITCLTRPTEPIVPSVGGDAQWKIISQLSLNHLSLGPTSEGDNSQSLGALKEILRLYTGKNLQSSQVEVGLLSEMSFEKITRRMGDDAWRGFVRGLGIELKSEATPFDGNGVLLLSRVLSHFMGLYVSLNSFTQLTLKNMNTNEMWKQWPAQIGKQKQL